MENTKQIFVVAWYCLLLIATACNSPNEKTEDAGPDSALDTGLYAEGDSGIDDDSGHDAGPVITCFIYVNVGSTAQDPNGLSWEKAFRNVQEGIDSAYETVDRDAGEEICEVWVAEGVYYIFETSVIDTVQLKPGVHVYGGFEGTEVSKAERDWKQHQTILDGRKESWEETDAGSPIEMPEQTYHVVTGSDGSVLDGFTIREGIAPDQGAGMHLDGVSTRIRNSRFVDNFAWEEGGGIMCDGCSALIENCDFISNTAKFGGAIYNQGGNPKITNCRFQGNDAFSMLDTSVPDNYKYIGGHGGGIYNSESEATISDCVFSQNTADMGGGGIYNAQSNPAIRDCEFDNNLGDTGMTQNTIWNIFQPTEEEIGGGGVYNNYSSPIISDCSFTSNSSENGGAIYNYGSNSIIMSCIIFKNSAGWGGGIQNKDSSPIISNSLINNNSSYSGGGIGNDFSAPTIINCTIVNNSATYKGGVSLYGSYPDIINSIVWGNTPNQIVYSEETPGATASVTYSNIQDSYEGIGNIDDEPAFEDIENGMFILSESSPCIDTADDNQAPPNDILGNDRVDVPGKGKPGTISDIGAYEYRP